MSDIPAYSGQLLPGEYAIVELFGHTTLVGRISESDQYGTKLLAIEPLLNGAMLPVVYQGGASIYRLTPCSAEVAWKNQPLRAYLLPPSIQAIAPPIGISTTARDYWGDDDDPELDPIADEAVAMSDDPGL